MESEIRYRVRYNNRGRWMSYGTPFATLNGAISCVARLQNAGYRATVYTV